MTDTHRADQRRVLHLVEPEKAVDTALSQLTPRAVAVEETAVEESLGRILMEDVASDIDIPAHDIAAMDGYAANSTDTSSASQDTPIKLRTTGSILGGSSEGFRIGRGEAVYVAMGSPIPEGADCVARLERVMPAEGSVELRRPVDRWKDVARRGEDVSGGEVVLSRSRVLAPYDIGLLIALGRRTVKVAKKLVVPILSVGDELTTLDEPRQGMLVNNYAYVIAGLVKEFEAVPLMLGVAKDSPQGIQRKLEEGLRRGDMVLTIGGCSVGVKDLVPDAVNSMGSLGVVAHGLKINAFRATGIGVVAGKPIVMLPGSAVSAVGAFYTVAVPLLNVLSGLTRDARPPAFEARLEGSLTPKKGLNFFAPVSVKMQDGRFLAEPLRYGTNLLSNLVKAHGYIYAKEGESLSNGEKVKVRLFNPSELLRLPHT